MVGVATVPELTALDRCDQCGAQAFVAVRFPRVDVELLFCGHHYVKHEDAVAAQGGVVEVDDRWVLAGLSHVAG